MTIDLKSPRPQITYLRRRLKVGEKLPETQTATPVRGIRLTNASEPVEEVNAEAQEVERRSTPTLTENFILTPQRPAIELNRRQSAIGSLVILGASYAAWETVDGYSGFIYASTQNRPHSAVWGEQYVGNNFPPPIPELPSPKNKNRALVEFHKGALVLNLRHFKQLKRLIVAPEQGQNLSIGTFQSPTITLAYEQGVVAYISVIDSKVEIRREMFRASVHSTFRIGSHRNVAASGRPSRNPVSNDPLRQYFSGR